MAELAAVSWSTSKMGQPEADGYQVRVPGTYAAFDQTEGAPRYAQVRTSGVQYADVTCIMDQFKAIYFEGWFYHTLLQGAKWFEMPLMTAAGIIVYDCHIVGGYRSTLLGGGRNQPDQWSIQFQIEYVYSRTRDNLPDDPGGNNIWNSAQMGIPEVNGYTLEIPELNIETVVADGPNRWRQTRHTGAQRARLTVLQRREQFVFFEGWFHHTLEQGSLGFQINLRTGNGYKRYNVHIVDGYSASLIKGENAWEASFDITYFYNDALGNIPLAPGDIIFAGVTETPSDDGEVQGDEDSDTIVKPPDFDELTSGAFDEGVFDPDVFE